MAFAYSSSVSVATMVDKYKAENDSNIDMLETEHGGDQDHFQVHASTNPDDE